MGIDAAPRDAGATGPRLASARLPDPCALPPACGPCGLLDDIAVLLFFFHNLTWQIGRRWDNGTAVDFVCPTVPMHWLHWSTEYQRHQAMHGRMMEVGLMLPSAVGRSKRPRPARRVPQRIRALSAAGEPGRQTPARLATAVAVVIASEDPIHQTWHAHRRLH